MELNQNLSVRLLTWVINSLKDVIYAFVKGAIFILSVIKSGHFDPSWLKITKSSVSDVQVIKMNSGVDFWHVMVHVFELSKDPEKDFSLFFFF